MKNNIFASKIFATFFAILVFSLLTSTVYAGRLFKCKAENGSYSYQQTRCQNEATIVKLFRDGRNKHVEGEEFTEDGGKNKSSAESQAIIQADLSQVLVSLQPIKIAVSEFYTTSGHWPKNFKDLNLSEQDMKSSLIDKVEIQKEGAVISHLNKKFGENKLLLLESASVMDNTSIEWQCYANFTKQLLTPAGGKPLCHSRKFK